MQIFSGENPPEFQGRLAKLGFYSSVMSDKEYPQIADDLAAIHELFLEKALERLTAWLPLAEQRLEGPRSSVGSPVGMMIF